MRRRHISNLPNSTLLMLVVLLALPKTSVKRVKSKSVHCRTSKLESAVTVIVQPNQRRVTGGKEWNHCTGPPPAAPPLASKKLFIVTAAILKATEGNASTHR